MCRDRVEGVPESWIMFSNGSVIRFIGDDNEEFRSVGLFPMMPGPGGEMTVERVETRTFRDCLGREVIERSIGYLPAKP